MMGSCSSNGRFWSTHRARLRCLPRGRISGCPENPTSVFRRRDAKRGLLMQEVPTQFADRLFSYDQLRRQGMVALYSQRHLASGILRYEVVRLRIAPAYVFPNGSAVPEREVYPGSSAWGRDGWTHHTLATAEAQWQRFVALREDVAAEREGRA